MRNFILGCLFVLLTSATLTKTDLLTIKPATPKSVVTYYGDNPKEFISKYTKMGYIFKHSSQSQGSENGSYWVTCLIVMEKY